MHYISTILLRRSYIKLELFLEWMKNLPNVRKKAKTSNIINYIKWCKNVII